MLRTAIALSLALTGAAAAQTATTAPAADATTPAAPAATAPAATPAAAPSDSAPMKDHAGMMQGMPVPDDATPATRAFIEAMDKMHQAMMIDYTGDADVDFVRGMIPHHQGAVDMAKIELEYGQDPELKKMAEEIVKAQEQEIKTMQDWLDKHSD